MKLFDKILKLIKETFKVFKEQEPVVYAAAIAFFTIFSLPSVLIIIVQTLGTILGEEEVRQQLVNEVSSLIGYTNAQEILNILENRSWKYSSFIGNAVSILFLIISATVIFEFIQKSLNSIWNVEPAPKKAVLKLLKDRLFSFSIIVILGFMMLVTLVVDAALSLFKEFLNSIFSNANASLIMTGLNGLVSLIVISSIFAIVYKVLPDAKIRWKDVGVGAVVTGVLFILGKYGIGIILSSTQVASTYGAAGSLAGILIWVFYSSILVLTGAIFTRVYAEQYGHDIKPQSHAVKVKETEAE